jgi:hypothetical protein
MPIVKNKTTENNRQFWSHVEEVTQQVNTWPDWMRNETVAKADEAQTSSQETDESKEAA